MVFRRSAQRFSRLSQCPEYMVQKMQHRLLTPFVVLLVFLFNKSQGNIETNLPFPEYDTDHEISYEDLLKVVRNGLPKTTSKKKIVVVGAGMAGLSAAYVLQQAGHEVQILEASDHVGGRVSTYRDPAGWQVELGALRIPTTHRLIGSFVKEIFKLETQEFKHFDGETYVYVNGIRVKTKDYFKNPDIIGYETFTDEKGITANKLFDAAMEPYIQEIREKGWKIFMAKYDGLSFRQSLMASKNVSDAALSMIAILNNIEGFFDYALSEMLEVFYDLTDDTQLYSIRGGNDLLPKAFVAALDRTKITYNARVTKVTQSPNQVMVEYVNEELIKNVSGDYVLMTPNPVAMSFMEFQPPLSSRKRNAMRQIQTDCSAKIVLSFSERFWEKEGIFGGRTITDLPSRLLYYMTGGSNFSGGLVVSYTWASESCVFAALHKTQLLDMVLSNLVTIHGEHIRGLFTGGVVKHWSLDPYTFGAYSYYYPFQRLRIHDDLEEAADRLWFAGEYINVPHAWMETAVKSALRTAVRLNTENWAQYF